MALGTPLPGPERYGKIFKEGGTMLPKKVSLDKRPGRRISARTAVMVAFLGLFVAYADPAFSAWEDYKPAEFEDIMRISDSQPDSHWDLHIIPPKTQPGAATICLYYRPVAYKFKLIYTGKTRTIDKSKKEALVAWLKSSHQDMKIANLFNKEMLFLDNATEYWLPVQDPLIPYFQKEIGKNKMVNLFVRFFGFIKTGHKREYLFTVNEFEKL
jgi:hypothetical protein